jgi:hypothetical protein
MVILKEIPGYPKYYCSLDGDVFSAKSGTYKELSKSVSKQKQGYYQVTLYNDRKMSTAKVHKLVAMTFLCYFPGCEIDHVNGNRLDNNICNLRITDHYSNMKYQNKTKNSVTGYSNIYKKRDKFQVQIQKDKVKKSYGVFYTLEEALAVRNVIYAKEKIEQE